MEIRFMVVDYGFKSSNILVGKYFKDKYLQLMDYRHDLSGGLKEISYITKELYENNGCSCMFVDCTGTGLSFADNIRNDVNLVELKMSKYIVMDELIKLRNMLNDNKLIINYSCNIFNSIYRNYEKDIVLDNKRHIVIDYNVPKERKVLYIVLSLLLNGLYQYEKNKIYKLSTFDIVEFKRNEDNTYNIKFRKEIGDRIITANALKCKFSDMRSNGINIDFVDCDGAFVEFEEKLKIMK